MKHAAAIVLGCALSWGGCTPDAGLDDAEVDQLSESIKRPDKSYSYSIVTPRGDEADVYYPRSEHRKGKHRHQVDTLPVVVLLQGALVDKQYYSHYASQVARAGFVVVVPNHYAALIPGQPPALFTSEMVVHDALAAMRVESVNPASPIADRVDPSRLGILGHSFGGAASLYAVQGTCQVPFCFGFFPPLPELKAAAVYGTHLVQGGRLLPIDTSHAPVALMQGMLDNPVEGADTYEELETPRALMLFEGMNHYGMTNQNNPPGANPDPVKPTLKQKKAVERLATWTSLFLRAHILGDAKAAKAIYKHGGDAKGHVSVIAER